MNYFWPSHINLIGGGRWARVYLDVLLQLLPRSVSISVLSHKGKGQTQEWLSKKKLDGRVELINKPAKFISGAIAIVANAPQDHVKSAQQAMEAGFPVLVEKPISLSFKSALNLVNYAEKNKKILGISQVFFFARYIENFVIKVEKMGVLKSIRFLWSDPAEESRYGETKRLNKAVPADVDTLPHILTILSLLNKKPFKHWRIKKKCNGNAVEIQMSLGLRYCIIRIEREADERKRIIEANTNNGSLRLDFSHEPGTISSQDKSQIADPDWNELPRPLARMLTIFFDSVRSGRLDERLSSKLPLHALQISDLKVNVNHNVSLETKTPLSAIYKLNV